jgi:hypothetical protein
MFSKKKADFIELQKTWLLPIHGINNNSDLLYLSQPGEELLLWPLEFHLEAWVDTF